MLKIFNTINRKKQEFQPINKTIGIYVCGNTVYDLCHIGHGRTFVIFDVIIRYLRYLDYKINYVRNITDVEDKIISKCIKNDEPFQLFTDNMINEMNIDFDKLNILRPNHEPRASHYIDTIIQLINQLIKKNHAYISKNGDVVFSVNSYEKYGSFSRQNLLKLKNKIDTKRDDFKINSLDFVLWKKTKKKNEVKWLSPWGYGRPGWHIECSAMNYKFFNNHFDIHGGGSDLIFPHHENEIAQSSCSFNGPFANIWIHTGIVTINKKKMSKSKGNIVKLRDILKEYNSEVVRYFFLSSHYRSQIEFNKKNVEQANSALTRLYISLYDTNINEKSFSNSIFEKKFVSSMNDDFNIPKVYAIFFKMANEINKLKKKKVNKYHNIAATLRKLGNILGLLKQDPKDFLQRNFKKNNENKKIQLLIKKRTHARKLKKWNIADMIRKELFNMGILLEDTEHSTNWKKIK